MERLAPIEDTGPLKEEVYTIIGLLADREYETVEYMTGKHVSSEALADTVRRCGANVIPIAEAALDDIAVRETHRRRFLLGPFRRQRRRFSVIARVPTDGDSDCHLTLTLSIWVEHDGLTESRIEQFANCNKDGALNCERS